MTVKDRSMAIAPYPMCVKATKVVHERGPRVVRIAHAVKVILSDGSEVLCQHSHGHTSETALRSCATELVIRLNEAAGIPKDAY